MTEKISYKLSMECNFNGKRSFLAEVESDTTDPSRFFSRMGQDVASMLNAMPDAPSREELLLALSPEPLPSDPLTFIAHLQWLAKSVEGITIVIDLDLLSKGNARLANMITRLVNQSSEFAYIMPVEVREQESKEGKPLDEK